MREVVQHLEAAVRTAMAHGIAWQQLDIWLEAEMRAIGLKARGIRPAADAAGLEGFDRFWQAYPARRRVDKKGCQLRWWKGNLDAEADAIVAAIAVLSERDQWSRDNWKFAPMSSTFLSQRRWDGVQGEDPRASFLEGAL